MTEDGPGPTSQDRSHPPALHRHTAMTNGVDPLMEAVQSSRPYSASHRVIADSPLPKLSDRDDAMLTVGEP